MSDPPRVTLRASGDWPDGAVTTAWVPDTRRTVPELEQRIDQAWSTALARLGPGNLFDGPMCRLERCDASPQQLRLLLSQTSYKPFLGTNLSDAAALADRFGADALANPVGLSTALQSADGWLLFGRRNASVAYYPNRVHPFAGALEPARDGGPPNVFAEIRRELREELGFADGDIASIRCMGMVEDRALRQPELVFHACSTRPRTKIEAMLARDEHHGIYVVRAAPDEVATALRDPVLTPVAEGTLALWSRRRGNVSPLI